MTARCLDEDLNADEATSFESILGLEIIKAFVKDRATEATASKQIRPLSSGRRPGGSGTAMTIVVRPSTTRTKE